MKYLLTVFTLCVVSSAFAELTAQEKQEIMEFKKQCMEENPTFDPSIFKDQQKSNPLPEDPAVKSFLFCFSKKSGSMTEEGAFNANVLREKLGARLNMNVDEAVDECTSTNSGSGPENAFALVNCLTTRLPPHDGVVL